MEELINLDELKVYSQERYEFDINALSREEILAIKNLAREKRADYGIAPIGKDIFRYIVEKESNLYFESQQFDNPDLDALIYMPEPKNDSTFIILNSNQPLMNQIFATAHEYYHYIKDLEEIRLNPRICSLSHLRGKSEHKASRFAAEFLLPDEVLRKYIDQWRVSYRKEFQDADLEEIAILCYTFTILYGMPLKAVLFRLYEEKYINDLTVYLSNYTFIKSVLKEREFKYSLQVKELMDTNNPYIEEIMYDLINKAYKLGYVSLDKLETHIDTLKLKKDIFEWLNKSEDTPEEDIDESLKIELLAKLNGMGQK